MHLRRLRLRELADRLRESLLFLPALMLASSVIVAVVLGDVDRAHQARALPWTFGFAPATASTRASSRRSRAVAAPRARR